MIAEHGGNKVHLKEDPREDARAYVAEILRFFCKTPASLHWQHVYQLSTSTPERDDTNSSVNMQIDYLVKSI